MVMRAGDEHVSEAVKLPPHRHHVGQRIADQIDGHQGKFALPFLENNGAGFERIMDADRLSVLTKAGHIDRFAANLRSNVRFREPSFQNGPPHPPLSPCNLGERGG